MRRVVGLIGVLMAAGAGGASAQDGGPDCAALFAYLANQFPVNLDQCEPVEPTYVLDECTPPSSFSGGPVTTHLILAIDASGSMAGSAGSLSKMEAAKREARAFLGDVHKDIAVGLMVYGHEGSNKPEGKAESCAASELVHGFDAPRAALGDMIAGLRPVGYTPIAGALEEAGRLVAALPQGKEGEAPVPVIYLISDGEETCDGDPVAAAKALIGAGIQTTVNTIGFAVDAETEAQLEAIAEAGGGTYYPAEDANALQQQLNAIREAEISAQNYRYCVDLNAGKIGVATHNEIIRVTGCYQKNNPARRTSAVLNFANKARGAGTPEASCADELTKMALADGRAHRSWLADRTKPLNDEALRRIDDLYRESGLHPE